jgi:hypothetical protein
LWVMAKELEKMATDAETKDVAQEMATQFRRP